MAHAKLSPSGSDRWFKCPGSIKLVDALGVKDNRANIHMATGTVAHTIGERCLTTGNDPLDYLHEVIEQEGFSITVDEEMVENIGYYVSYVHEYLDASKGDEIFIEEKLPLFYSPSETGTGDVVGISERNKTLHVIDLKYGKGLRVEPEDNTQLIIYGLCAWLLYRDMFEIETVAVHIAQPRLKHMVAVSYTIAEMEDWMTALTEAAAETEEDSPRINPGESQCRWCDANAVCSAYASYCLDATGNDFDNVDAGSMSYDRPSTLDFTQLGYILSQKKMVENWLKSIEAHIQSELEHGRDVPGYKIVEGRANRKWSNEEDALKALRARFNKGELVTEKLISPPQAEKLMKAEKASTRLLNKVNALIVRPEGKPVLAVASDPRPALSFGDDFNDLDESDDLLG